MTAHSSTESPVPTSTVDEEFLDLILADDDLLQAEFDAIVAASWSDLDRPPPRPKSPPPPAGPPGRALAMRGWVQNPHRRWPDLRSQARERSPP